MDPLSVTASIISVLQLTSKFIEYLDSVKDAPKDRANLVDEASNLNALLRKLRYRVELAHSNEPWYNEAKLLAIQNGPLDQYRVILQQLYEKAIATGSLGKLCHALLWKFNKPEIENMIWKIERLKNHIHLALDIDHFKLNQATNSTVRGLQLDQHRLQFERIANWLSPTNFAAQQVDIISRRVNQTGQWFLESDKFNDWLHGKNTTLFCPGIPGAGKTMLAAITIDYLAKMEASERTGLTYLYCNYKSQRDINASTLLGAILKQLVQSQPTIDEQISSLYEQYTRFGTKPSFQKLSTALKAVLKKFLTVYVVIDALDECPSRDGICNQLLAELRHLQRETDLRLMATSRHIPEIENEFRSMSMVEIRATNADVSQYVRDQIHRLPRCIRRDSSLQEQVVNQVSEAVDGMFLLAPLRLNSLLGKGTPKQVKIALDKFQSAFDSNKGLEQVYDEAYDDAIKRIENQHVEERERAIKIISWVTYVQRPLTANELCHAMAVELGDEELDVENFLDIEDIISVCAGLVIVDKRCNVVRFVHYTTQEYFERILRHLNPLAQQQIAQTCLTYLSFNTFLAGTCPSDEDFRSRTERYLFLDYAARHWVYHVKSVQEHLTKLVLVLLQNPNLLSCAVQAMSIPEYQFFGFSQQYPKDVTLLHLTARFGLLHLTRASLTYSRASAAISTNLKDSYGRAPLSWAAGNGHEAVVNLLIERDDIEADSKDAGDRTPLSYAAEGGYEAIVKLLIDRNDVEADSKDNTGRTPLSYAVSSGHESSLKVLLETGRVNPDSKDKNSQTPLAWAAMNGHACVVKLLLATKKVDTDSKTIDRYYDNMSVFGITSFQTPLSLAAENGHEIIVKLLLETHKVNIDSKDEFGRSPLSLAAQNGHAAVVKLLWETGKADPDSKATGRFCAGRTPLSFAAERGYEAIVRQLLGMNQVDPDSKTVGVYLPGRTPLSWAAGNGNEAVVSLLLKTGKVDVNSKSTGKYVPNRAPILWLGNSRERAIELGTTSEIFEGRTPLSWAAESGHTAVIKLLLENGANTSLKDKDGRTPMSWAASNGHEVVTKLLLTTPAVDDASKASL